MAKVTGKIMEAETNLGLSDLIVSFYEVKFDEITEKWLSWIVTETPFDVWNKIPGKRLGSTQTVENGKFEFEYQKTDLPDKSNEIRNPVFIFFVTLPSHNQPNPSPQIVYVSAPLPFGSTGVESFVIKISSDTLLKNKNDSSTPITEIDDLTKLFNQIETIHKEQIEREPKKSFSDWLKEKKEERTEQSPLDEKLPLIENVDLKIPVKVGDTPKQFKQVELKFEKDQVKFLLHESDDQILEPVFAGVKYLKASDIQTNEITLQLSEENTVAELLVPFSPLTLEFSSTEPDELYQFYRNQNRKS